MYIVQEIQANNGTPALLPAIVKATREEAESAFYMICGSAVLSSVPVHTVTVYTEEGFQIKELTKCFKHAQAPAPEVEPVGE